jgi:hypothetical protein
MLAVRAAVLSLARALTALGAILWAVQGCSLTADLDVLQAGESALDCRDDEKVCEDAQGRGFCVALDVHQLGCDDPSCRPCKLVGVKSYRCEDNKCVRNECKEGWAGRIAAPAVRSAIKLTRATSASMASAGSRSVARSTGTVTTTQSTVAKRTLVSSIRTGLETK